MLPVNVVGEGDRPTLSEESVLPLTLYIGADGSVYGDADLTAGAAARVE